MDLLARLHQSRLRMEALIKVALRSKPKNSGIMPLQAKSSIQKLARLLAKATKRKRENLVRFWKGNQPEQRFVKNRNGPTGRMKEENKRWRH